MREHGRNGNGGGESMLKGTVPGANSELILKVTGVQGLHYDPGLKLVKPECEILYICSLVRYE